MKQLNQVLATIAVVAVCSGAFTQVAQAEVVTTQLSGTIASGYDGLGIFGTPGSSLAGLNYSQTFSTNLAQGYNIVVLGPTSNLYYENPADASFNGATQVGGHNYQWTLNGARGEFSLYNYATNGLGGPDQVYLGALGNDGRTPDGFQLVTESRVYSFSQPFLSQLDPSQRLTINPAGLEVQTSFYLQRGGEVTYFQSTSVGSAAALNPVPEPETWAMLVAGIGMLGFMARRRARLTA